ncbi:MAG: DNA-directed RNA polymerase subunit alpha C-terminal domain-containing protein [Nitrolancea sp.]
MFEDNATPIESLGLSAPAVRALTRAGYTFLEQLTHITVKDLKPLHGFGPKTVRQLREVLAARGLSFSGE